MADIGIQEAAPPRPRLADRIVAKAEQIGGPQVGEVARKAQDLFKQAYETGRVFAGVPLVGKFVRSQIESLQKGVRANGPGGDIIDAMKSELYNLLPTTLEGGIDIFGGAVIGMVGGNLASTITRNVTLSGKEMALCAAGGAIVARAVGMTSLLSAALHYAI